jgi:probable rRNA maturation factor
MVRLTAEINQQKLRGGQRLPIAAIKNTLKVIENELRLRKSHHISIGFVSEKEMKRLNKMYRGEKKITDVLSFGFEKELGTLKNIEEYGELVFNYEQAARQAKMMKHSVRKELQFLIVHGTLHLFGYDHEDPKGAKKMFLLQTEILKRLKINPRI